MVNIIKTLLENPQEFYSQGEGFAKVTYISTGEPCDDYAAVKAACEQLSDKEPIGPNVREVDPFRWRKTTCKDDYCETSFMAELCSKAK